MNISKQTRVPNANIGGFKSEFAFLLCEEENKQGRDDVICGKKFL